jgi:DNA-binding transcriptional regulator GbsR (MarR family)
MSEQQRELDDFAERTAAMLIAAGLQRMPARVLMALMTSENAGLSSQELQERLGVSAAAVSGAVRYLQGLGIVRRRAQSGSRRDLYELPDGAWYTASMQTDSVYQSLAVLAEGAMGAIEDQDSPRGTRIREMADYFRFMQRRMPELLEEWQAIRDGERDAG